MGEALQSQIQCYLHHPNQEPDQQEQIAPECQTLKAHTSTKMGIKALRPLSQFP